ncbi:MAG: AbrB/MazE/SpoVT family DNA-binding domain-containing protein [Dehalococcoidia bacterium]|nr:AbrB/MazE/SpoVT family DNA-binding domain-containing protein [Dehalococcoidia bacterium]
MGSRVRISRQDGEFVVHIPEDIARDWGAREGLVVDVTTSGDRLVLHRERYNLSDLLERVTPENLHGEIDFGKPEGREVW